MHGVLNFRLLLRAQSVVFDKRELAGVNGKGDLREIDVIEAAFGKRCGYPVIVTRRGEQTCLTHVNLQAAVVGIDSSIGTHQPNRCCEKEPCHSECERRVALTSAHCYWHRVHFDYLLEALNSTGNAKACFVSWRLDEP